MKKTINGLRATFIFVMAIALTLAAGFALTKTESAYADTDKRGWRVASPHTVENYERTGIIIDDASNEDVNGINQNFIRAEYIYSTDMESGLEFAYMFPEDGDFSVGEEVYVFENPNGATIVDKGAVINDARFYDHSYVKFTVMGSGGNGFEATFYHQYSDDNAYNPNHIFVNLCYLSPSIQSDGGVSKLNGRHYVETVYSYRSTFGVWHTLSCFKTNGWFVIAADGTTFVPVPDYGTFDLSSAKVSVEVKSVSTPELKVALKTPEQNFEKSVYGTWMTLGESKVEREYDGTLRMEVEEKNDLLDWTAANTGNMLMRERVFSTKGYSVDQPIVIDCCLDYGVGPQNYLAIKLGRSPLDATTPIKYEKMGKGSTVSVSPFADEGKLAYSETGSSVFIGALAISARIDVDDGLTDYYVAWNVKPNNQGVYQGISSLDRISFQVNDNGTDVFFNNIYAYTFKNMKRSFFAQSGYMAYPYICFSEIPRQPDKNNVLHLTGVNAPYDDGLPVKKYKSSDGDLNITLENYGAEISLYQDKDLKREVNAADYSYADGVLTLKRSFFTGRPFGLNEIFAASENGVRYLKVRYFPDDYVENPPTVAASQWDDLGVPTVVYDRKTVVSYTVENGAVKNIKTQDNTNDMRIKLSLNGYTFDYIYGWGILNSDYMYNEKQGTLLIRNSFLTEHANGSYSLVLVVRDEDDIARETKFNVSLVNYSAFEATYTEEIEGCGSAVQGETAVAVVLALCVLSFITVRTRKSKDNIK